MTFLPSQMPKPLPMFFNSLITVQIKCPAGSYGPPVRWLALVSPVLVQREECALPS